MTRGPTWNRSIQLRWSSFLPCILFRPFVLTGDVPLERSSPVIVITMIFYARPKFLVLLITTILRLPNPKEKRIFEPDGNPHIRGHGRPIELDDGARRSGPKCEKICEDFTALDGLLLTLKQDRDARGSQKGRLGIRRRNVFLFLIAHMKKACPWRRR